MQVAAPAGMMLNRSRLLNMSSQPHFRMIVILNQPESSLIKVARFSELAFR
jgi:hypothetical protein